MTAVPGTLYLVPNTLDFGTGAGTPALPLDELLPLGVIRRAAALQHWVAENAKTTRAFLKRVDAVVSLSVPLQSISIAELPRPAKGRSTPNAEPRAMDGLLHPVQGGADMGLISEAGLPGVADPGALLVAAAHRQSIRVVALPGAGSLMLALASSGLEGQSFAFVGYLPVEAAARAARLRELEACSKRQTQTQIVIETPYRNPALLDALLAHLQPTTRLSVSCGLTLAAGFSRSDPVQAWRARPLTLPANIPAVFCFLG